MLEVRSSGISILETNSSSVTDPGRAMTNRYVVGWVFLAVALLVSAPRSGDVASEASEAGSTPDRWGWRQQGKNFFRSSTIILETDFLRPQEAEICFDGNLVGYDAFGDWEHTLRQYPTYSC